MIDLKEKAQLRQEGARIANILIALHKMFPHMRGLLRVYQVQRELAAMRQEAEVQRIAGLVETKTTVLPAIPKYVSARLLLFGEDVAQVVAEEERERNTDPVHESAHATRKLSAAHFIETEHRAVVKVERMEQ